MHKYKLFYIYTVIKTVAYIYICIFSINVFGKNKNTKRHALRCLVSKGIDPNSTNW